MMIEPEDASLNDLTSWLLKNTRIQVKARGSPLAPFYGHILFRHLLYNFICSIARLGGNLKVLEILTAHALRLHGRFLHRVVVSKKAEDS